MKNYYIRADIGEEIPSYDFVLKAKDLQEAQEQANKIIESDYPEQYEYMKESDFLIEAITANELLEKLTLN